VLQLEQAQEQAQAQPEPLVERLQLQQVLEILRGQV